MKNKIFIGSIVCLVVLNILLSFKCFNLSREQESLFFKVLSIQAKDEEVKKKLSSQNENRYLEVINTNFKLDENEVLFDQNGESLSLKEIFKNNEKLLVVRFQAKGCNLCLDAELKKLKKYEKALGKDKILLITDKGFSFRELEVLKTDSELISCKVYTADFMRFKFDSEKQSGVFVLSQDLTISNFHIPDYTLQEKSDFYYRGIIDSKILND